MKPSEICDQAAARIEAYGWAQGEYKTPEGYCIVGACRTAVGIPLNDSTEANIAALTDPAYSHATDALCGVGNTGNLPTWNDHQDRTKEEVISLLRTTAGQLREDNR